MNALSPSDSFTGRVRRCSDGNIYVNYSFKRFENSSGEYTKVQTFADDAALEQTQVVGTRGIREVTSAMK